MPGSLGGESPHASLDEIIRTRENDFFRELAAEYKGTHPLMHMVASARKLHSIGVPIHQLDPRAAMKKSKQAAKTSPYEKPLTLVEYTGRAVARGPHVANPKKTHDGIRKEGSEGTSTSEKVSSSANRHRQFLDKTMSAVHEQLESPALADV